MKVRILVISAAIMIVPSGCNSLSGKPMESARGTMKIVCLGDSITGQPNLKAYLKWSFVLECMLEARMGEGKVTVLNRGIGGDTTGGALKRLQSDVLDEKPDIAIIMLGGNDAGGETTRKEVRANLEEIVRKAKGVGAKVLLLQYHVLPNPEQPETAWRHVDDNNELIAEVGVAEGAAVLDLGSAMQDALKTHKVTEFLGRQDGVAHWQTKPITQEHLASDKDGVHLSPGGELVFARAIFKKLMSLDWIQ